MVNAHLNRSRLRDMRSGKKHAMVSYKQRLGIYKEVRKTLGKEEMELQVWMKLMRRYVQRVQA